MFTVGLQVKDATSSQPDTGQVNHAGRPARRRAVRQLVVAGLHKQRPVDLRHAEVGVRVSKLLIHVVEQSQLARGPRVHTLGLQVRRLDRSSTVCVRLSPPATEVRHGTKRVPVDGLLKRGLTGSEPLRLKPGGLSAVPELACGPVPVVVQHVARTGQTDLVDGADRVDVRVCESVVQHDVDRDSVRRRRDRLGVVQDQFDGVRRRVRQRVRHVIRRAGAGDEPGRKQFDAGRCAQQAHLVARLGFAAAVSERPRDGR